MTVAGTQRRDEAGGSSTDNGFTALRLGLAAIVLLSHAVGLGGFPFEPVGAIASEANVFGGTLAVCGFFALSGYLLTDSRRRGSRIGFLRNRVLRIFPGFWLCLLVTAFVIAPLGAILTQTDLEPAQMIGYVGANLGLKVQAANIGAFTATNPDPRLVNGSLWTLFPEFLCYIGLALTPRRYLPVVPLAIVIACVYSLTVDAPGAGLLSIPGVAVPFAAGCLIRAWQIPTGRVASTAAAVVALALVLTGHFVPWGLPFLALAVIGFGLAIPLRWKTDLSYGVYLYAFPVSQLVAAAGLNGLGYVPYVAIVGAVVLPLSLVSWRLIESPALRLKRSSEPKVVERTPGPQALDAEAEAGLAGFLVPEMRDA
jgi:peptidoglycan/LPS O-acetylase OafA/YrhL